MYDLITIGDIKLDVFISLDLCKEKCDMRKKQLCLRFGEKILTQVQDQQIAGSAPNVATALSRMGYKTAVVSNMGDDNTYGMALEFLRAEGVDTKFIKSHKNTNSAYSAVLDLQGEKTLLASYIAKPYKMPKARSKWLFLSEMGDGYEKLFRDAAKYATCGQNTILCFNPGNDQIQERKKELYTLIKAAHILFVNMEEGRRVLKNKRLGIKSIARGLFNLGPAEVAITDGRNGSYGYDGTNFYFCPIFPGPRIEATGAGDSFAAAYVGAAMERQPMPERLKWGSINAAETVQHIGPTKGLLSKARIKSRLRDNPNYAAKIIN